MTQRDLSPILDLALLYNPKLANVSFFPIHAWLNDGCDIEKDILPTLRQVMGRKPGIRSFDYFTSAITEAKDRRLAQEKLAERQKEVPAEEQAQKDFRRAKSIAWFRDKKIVSTGISPADFRWLEQYEQQHGRIPA